MAWKIEEKRTFAHEQIMKGEKISHIVDLKISIGNFEKLLGQEFMVLTLPTNLIT